MDNKKCDAKSQIFFFVTGGLLITTLASFSSLSSTTVSAEDIVDEVNITVPVSCTMSGSGESSHNAEILNGHYDSNIGETTMKATCNDGEGFAIYAIGYTDDTDGKNVLTSSTLGSEHDIVTGTATGPVGNDDISQWAMKLSTITNPTPTYPIIIAGSTDDTTREQGDPDYSTFQEVPDDYTLVAKRTSGTDINPSGQQTAEGSTLKTTYQAYISRTQVAGTYTGQVKYTLIHPNDAPAPVKPVATDSGYISYNPNARNVTDSMGDQSITSEQTFVNLWPSNFQRPGYGFAGWTDKHDWVLNQNDGNGNGTGLNEDYHIYGPSETMFFEAGQYSDPNPGLSLYAVWVPSAGTIQDWTGCSSMSSGQVTALTDSRDQQTYAVGKLADGNCWMMENLRLDNQYTTSAADIAKAQGYNSSFIGLANPETDNFTSSTVANSLYSIDGSTAAPAITGQAQNRRFPRYNNQNTSAPVSDMTSLDANIYSYGNYYTWTATVADTSNYSTGGQVITDTSICPHGWHIPYGSDGTGTNGGNTSGGFNYLGKQSGDASSSLTWRKYPNNYIYSGSFITSIASGRGGYGYYWSSTVIYDYNAYDLDMSDSHVNPGSNNRNKYTGFSIRCVLSQ